MKAELRERFAGYRAGKSLKGTETEKNLLKAFAGESQARNRYVMFAEKAREDGYDQISAIFTETAHNEQLHAQTFFAFMEGGAVEITAKYPAGIVGSTFDNLIAAVEGEHEESVDLYPQFADIAAKEGFVKISNQFKMIAKVEREHEERYRKLAQNVKDNKVFAKDDETIWICRECGYIHIGKQTPDVCPVCLHPKSVFEIRAKNY
jgi:rubrerythrin